MSAAAARDPADTPFVAAGADAVGTVFSCSLCGHRFTHGAQVCGGCPLGSDCRLVRCPNCGFQFPRGSRTVDWWRRLRRRRARS